MVVNSAIAGFGQAGGTGMGEGGTGQWEQAGGCAGPEMGLGLGGSC